MKQILEAVLSGDTAEVAGFAVPESYRGVVVRKDEQTMFEGVASRDKDPRKSLHVDEVATPALGPGEVIVAVMASSVNFNTVWTSIFEPVSTFGVQERYGKLNDLTKRHDLPYHVVGSDLSGVVLAVGAGVSRWKAGDKVVALGELGQAAVALQEAERRHRLEDRRPDGVEVHRGGHHRDDGLTGA